MMGVAGVAFTQQDGRRRHTARAGMALGLDDEERRSLTQAHAGASLVEWPTSFRIDRKQGREPALLVRSSSPYQKMKRKGLTEYIGGPVLARWGNEFIVGGRRFTKAGPRTILYWLRDDALHEATDLPTKQTVIIRIIQSD